MKRKVILFVTLFAFLFLANVSAKTCCCEYDIFKGDGSIWKQTCGMSHQTGEDCEVLCNDEYGGDRITGVFENWGCNSTERCQPYCGNRVIESGEKCEIGQNTCKEDEVCDKCQCRSVEICNGKDDDKDNYVDESNDCEDSQCYAEGDCPLGYVCMKETIEAAMVGRTITGMAGETGQCQICKSVCKVCPPHPPQATKNNPLGICDPDKGYPFSKDCLDYLNKVSCMTCEDKDYKIPGRETPAERKNDGAAGVNQNGDFIWSGTSFEKGTGKIVKDETGNVLFPKLKDNNKDSKAKDYSYEYDNEGNKIKDEEIIDCRFGIPVFNDEKNPYPLFEANAFVGMCSGRVCQPKECISDCSKQRGYEKWLDKNGDKVNPIGPFVSLIIPEKKFCPKGDKKVIYSEYINTKYGGSWGGLFKGNEPNCKVEPPVWAATCTQINLGGGEKLTKLEKDKYILMLKFIKDCKNEHGSKAYYYIATGANYFYSGAYCWCIKADKELLQFAEAIQIPEFGGKVEFASILPYLKENMIKEDRDLRRILDFIKNWVNS